MGVRVRTSPARAGDAPLVLVHGLGATSRSFARLLDHLPDHGPAGFRPHLVELPDGDPVDVEADALAARLGEEGVVAATVLGHSRGGAVAVALAQRHPERVARLVLVATPPTVASRLASDGRQERLLAVPLLGDAMWTLAPRAALRRGLESAVAPGRPVPDVLVDDLAATPRRAFVGATRSLGAWLARRSLHDRLAGLGVRTDVVVGLVDRRVDPGAFADLDDLPAVRVTRWAGVGHSPAWEVPERIADLLGEDR